MAFGKEKGRASGTEFAQPAPVTPQPQQSSGGYGIQQAIDLMRSLPSDPRLADVMLQVVRRTLESAHIGVGQIIADATRKEEQIEARLRTLQEEIVNHRREIETRAAEVTRLQAELSDISLVRNRFTPR